MCKSPAGVVPHVVVTDRVSIPLLCITAGADGRVRLKNRSRPSRQTCRRHIRELKCWRAATIDLITCRRPRWRWRRQLPMSGIATVTLVIVPLSVNLYCAVWPEVFPVAVIRNFTPPSVSMILKVVSVNEPLESAVSVKNVSSESVSWICVVTVSPGIHPVP